MAEATFERINMRCWPPRRPCERGNLRQTPVPQVDQEIEGSNPTSGGFVRQEQGRGLQEGATRCREVHL